MKYASVEKVVTSAATARREAIGVTGFYGGMERHAGVAAVTSTNVNDGGAESAKCSALE